MGEKYRNLKENATLTDTHRGRDRLSQRMACKTTWANGKFDFFLCVLFSRPNNVSDAARVLLFLDRHCSRATQLTALFFHCPLAMVSSG